MYNLKEIYIKKENMRENIEKWKMGKKYYLQQI
jgi:hypothetical protein